jgi:CubicO group peptidase (beta-lactamase class C family)
MSIRHGALGLVAAAAIATGAQAHAQSPESARSHPADYADRAQRLRAWIDRVHSVGSIAGLSAAVVDGDSILVLRSAGVADASRRILVTDTTRFYIASTTKAFMALATTMLSHQGKLDLDLPVASYLPGVLLHPPLNPSAITIRDLLSMRDGIDDGPVTFRTSYTGEGTSDASLVRLLRHHPPASAGRAFRYSNIGYIVAGLAMHARLGNTWKSFVDSLVLRPAGMRHTSASVSTLPPRAVAYPHRIDSGGIHRMPLLKSDASLHAGGGHFSTAGDLARFLIAQMNGGVLERRHIFPMAALAETHRNHTTQDRQAGFRHRIGWGLGWDIATFAGDTVLERPGGFPGYYSYVAMVPARRHGVVVLATGSTGAADAIAEGALHILAGRATASLLDSLHARVRATHERALIARARAPVPLPAPARRYAGVFTSDLWGTLSLEPVGDSLIVRIGDGWGVAQGDTSSGNLIVTFRGSTERVRLEHAPDSSVIAVVLDGMRFTRSRGAAIRTRKDP